MIELNKDLYKSDNVLSDEEIVLVLEKLRKQGKKIGLCTGSFDLLHPGHIAHLDSAKKMCDILVVAVALDSFTSKNKIGKGRPVFSHDIRAFMISKLKSVDFVIFDNSLPKLEIINLIKPDIVIKGPDYSDEGPNITELKELVKSLEGEMGYTKDEKLSTSDILRYIKEKIEID